MLACMGPHDYFESFLHVHPTNIPTKNDKSFFPLLKLYEMSLQF